MRARNIADHIARRMHYYPSVLRTMPPSLIDIDEAYSKVRHMTNYHCDATCPRDEGGAQSGAHYGN